MVVTTRAHDPCILMRNFHRVQTRKCLHARNLRSNVGAF